MPLELDRKFVQGNNLGFELVTLQRWFTEVEESQAKGKPVRKCFWESEQEDPNKGEREQLNLKEI